MKPRVPGGAVPELACEAKWIESILTPAGELPHPRARIASTVRVTAGIRIKID